MNALHTRAQPETAATPQLDLTVVRGEFPVLGQTVHGKPLVYLDNAATTQKPRGVIDALTHYYENDNANVHRGVHVLGDRATAAYEAARARVQQAIGARSPYEIVFVRGTTEAINLVAQTFGRARVGPGDEVVVTWMEHHSDIVPWQMLCEEKGAKLRVVPIIDKGELCLDAYRKLLTPRTRLVAVSHVSNVLGTINPVGRMIGMAHEHGIPVLVDGAQAVAHLDIDVQELDCDFYAFSGHKVYGPMGIGVLYGKARHLEAMPPWQGGGDMVRTVTFEKTTYNVAPFKFEAGTPNVAGAVGLAAAFDVLDGIGREAVAAHEAGLSALALERLGDIPGLHILGAAAHRAGVFSFVMDDPPLSAVDVGTRLDLDGIAVRTGHHCCQPLMQRFGVPGTVRASLALYNTADEVEQLAAALRAIAAGSHAVRRADVAPSTGEPEYPPAFAASVDAAAAALLEELDDLGDWSERYEFLIELGRTVPPMPEELKTDENRVRGCQSTVFMAVRVRPGSDDLVEFLADSDGEIVRGLLAVLQHLFSGQSACDVCTFDFPAFLDRAGLQTNLLTSRRNGLAEMIKRLRGYAADLCTPRGGGLVEDVGLSVRNGSQAS
jgi:cysteine desulfurase / selenocysteine lyase